MSDLEKYRQEIDAIDEQIIRLLAKRRQAVQGIIDVKSTAKLAAHQPERMDEVLASRRQLASDNNLDPELIEAVWRLLIAYFTKLEEEALQS